MHVRWALRIQEVSVSDGGGYECQVTTANKTIEIISLNVLGEKGFLFVGADV